MTLPAAFTPRGLLPLASTRPPLAHEATRGPLAQLQPQLAAAHRTACLRHDEFGQAVYLNLLLRAHLAAGAAGGPSSPAAEVDVDFARRISRTIPGSLNSA